MIASVWLAGAAGILMCGCSGEELPTASPSQPEETWCDRLPRPANQVFAQVQVGSGWFQVYRVGEGVFALVEPFQFQETISYLIVGTERALLFDTGLGMSPIRPIVEALTDLPVVVLNSHTHYDHVGGNAEFDEILAVDSLYTRKNQEGFPHSALEGEAAPEAFCDSPPEGFDPLQFHTRPWAATQRVTDGEQIDLGDRMLEVLQVPGHTPDALALLDRRRGFLWTGDSYYDATIWLYVPETDLDAYQRSIDRLAALAPSLNRLLPAHNTISADPNHLADAAQAIREVRAGTVSGIEQSGNRIVFRFQNFSILTSTPLLEGAKGDLISGGSGLSTWP